MYMTKLKSNRLPSNNLKSNTAEVPTQYSQNIPLFIKFVQITNINSAY